MKEFDVSLASFDKSLAMKSSYADAIKWKKRVLAMVEEEQNRGNEVSTVSNAVDQSDIRLQVQSDDTNRTEETATPQGVMVV